MRGRAAARRARERKRGEVLLLYLFLKSIFADLLSCDGFYPIIFYKYIIFTLYVSPFISRCLLPLLSFIYFHFDVWTYLFAESHCQLCVSCVAKTDVHYIITDDIVIKREKKKRWCMETCGVAKGPEGSAGNGGVVVATTELDDLSIWGCSDSIDSMLTALLPAYYN